MRKYLQLTRAHTAPLEAIPALMGAALAVGSLWSVDVAAWGIVGVLYHLAGYGHNSLSDWVAGYDKDDPHKQHHPLNTGAISEAEARWVINLLMAAAIIITLYLTFGNAGAVISMFTAIAFGLAYNIIGKATQLKFVFISVAHTMMFVIPFLALGGSAFRPEFLLGALFVFLWVAFQISVSGEIKDIVQDESNFLRKLGVDFFGNLDTVDDQRISFSNHVRRYAYSLKILTALTSLMIIAVIDVYLTSFVFLCIFIIATFALTARLVEDGKWERKRRIKQMSMIEMFTAFMFIYSFSSIIGPYSAFILMILSMMWVVVGNNLLWGSTVAPKV